MTCEALLHDFDRLFARKRTLECFLCEHTTGSSYHLFARSGLIRFLKRHGEFMIGPERAQVSMIIGERFRLDLQSGSMVLSSSYPLLR